MDQFSPLQIAWMNSRCMHMQSAEDSGASSESGMFVVARIAKIASPSNVSPTVTASIHSTTTKIAKMPEPDSRAEKKGNAAQARQVVDIFHEISTLLVSSPPFPSIIPMAAVPNADDGNRTRT